MSVDDVRYKLADELQADIVYGGFLPYVRGVGADVLEWFRPYADIVLTNIGEFDQDRSVALLTACSYAKPYSMSWIHYGIRKALYEAGLLDQIEYWHLSSAGLIPSCLEEVAPFCCYDWNNDQASVQDLKELRETLGAYFASWMSRYAIPFNKTVVTYFRSGSNTQRAIAGASESSRAVMILAADDPPPEMLKPITLNGAYQDPDCALLCVSGLQALIQVLFECNKGNDGIKTD